MKGAYGRLSTIILLATTLALQEQARLNWNHTFSPTDGYRNIRHRSQSKLRKLARQRN